MNNKSLFIRENDSKDASKPLQLNWFSKNHASNKEVALFTNHESSQLVNNIINLNISSSFSSAFITFFTTALYRHTYQSEFEIHYTQKNDANIINQNNTLKFLRLNFQNHTQQTANETCHSVSTILSTSSGKHSFSPPSSQSTFCLVELEQSLDETLVNLRETCASYKGEIWPVIEKKAEGYTLRWLYDQCIPIEIVIALQSHMLQLVNQAIKNADIPLFKYAILTNKETQQQIDFSKGKYYKDNSILLYKIIEKYALTHPNNIAVTFQQTNLTYNQLNTQANNLAHYLLSKNISIGNIVAVHIMPSVNILVSILAIHKIGAVYVPIDPSFPSMRIKAILDEVNPAIILCDNKSDIMQEKYLSVSHSLNELINISGHKENPNKNITPEDVSHIYFTSGTTGKPKGVVSTHKNLIHYISSAINCYHFDKNDIFIAAARFTFSISMFELIVPLVAGGRVKILPKETILDLVQLSKAVSSATVFHFGPSLLRQLLPFIENNYSSYKAFENLKHVSSGGDMVPPETLEKLKTIFINADIFVIYGSSEISCMGCTHQVPRNKIITKTLVGSPHQNVQVRLFDENMNMVPIGTIGKIYFSGDGLVKGYLNLPELTAEKFIMINNQRYYDIGDIGRLDQHGNIELLGREDFQVQIRGMRIELLEVEACLKKHPAIFDCVVIARSLQENEEKSLVAYIVTNDENNIANDLTYFIADQLPNYMIPTIFVQLDKLPTNHNAKLDRNQLPSPNSRNMIVSNDFKSASNDVEKILINIWEDLFNIGNIGIDHNFFELGGDSLLAVSFLIQVDKKFGKFIPISIMMDTPTISEIAKMVTSDKPIEGIGDIVVLKKGNSDPPLFCLDAIFSYKDLANSLDTKRMICGVHLEKEKSMVNKSTDSKEYRVFSSVENIATRYLKSIRTFQIHGPYYLCGHSFGGIIALEVARKLQEEGETVQLVAIFDAFAPGYKESLSYIKRISYHFRILKKSGWPYLKQKIAEFMVRKALSANISNNLVKEAKSFRNELRDKAFKSYLPKPYQGEVILFKARERKDFEVGMEDLGWGKFINKLVEYKISGDHYEIIKHGHVEELANILIGKII